MSRPEATDEDKVVETWESAVPGAVWVWVYDRREDRYTKACVGGASASKRLHITRDDRKWNQEQIPVENQKLDPFTNGALRFIHAATRDDSLDMRYHLSDADLQQLFEVRDLDEFMDVVRDFDSELILRRVSDMASTLGTVAQNDAVKELVAERYPIGGTQRSMKEIFETSDRVSETRLSF